MAISWIAALKLIPWSDVISNAPMVADGARKLCSTVAKKPAQAQPESADSRSMLSTGAQAISALEARVAAMESALSDLHTQMLASSELIKALAEQNSQLIVRVETSRARLQWLAIIGLVSAVCAIGSLVLLFVGRAA
jgi:DNA repair exonuclease SbcCD ATPase subunit